MDNPPRQHDPVEEMPEIEITDLPASSDEQDRSMIWLERALLAWQRSIARHRRRWRLASLFTLALLCLLVLGFVVENLIGLLAPRSAPASSIVIFPTSAPFNPYLYPHSNHPDATYKGHQGFVANIVWSPDGTRFASGGGYDDIVHVRNRITGKDLIYRGHTNEVMGLAWSPDGHYIASASRDMTVQIWNATTGRRIRLYRASKSVYSLAWSPDGTYIAFGDFTNLVHIWNIRTNQEVRTLVGHEGVVLDIAWSPDGTRLATASVDFTVRIWQFSSGKSLVTYEHHGDVVISVAWSPDGRLVASGGDDTSVQVWNPNNGQLVRKYQNHDNAINGVAWSPDGRFIASASDDQTVQIWRVNTGTPVFIYLIGATCVAWSPDGKYLAVGDRTGLIAVWNISLESLRVEGRISTMSVPAQRVATFGTTIFTEMNQLAQESQALNLGQGKPDFDTPPIILEQLKHFLSTGQHNQYAPGPGTPALRQAVADHAARFYNLSIDPVDGIIVTAGATEGIFAAVLGLVDPGDEVIVIEPFYDSYVPNILMANARPVYVPLHPPDWTFDPAELRAAFTKRTRALILNTPHNPTGRVFTRAELEAIAALCIEHDVTVISDEVYEHLYFAPATHLPIATLPGMFERTVTVSSAGKLFSATGWKIGWVAGPPDLVAGVGRAHQFITFAVHHPTQEAIAYALNLPASYYHDFQSMYTTKRGLMMDALDAAGLTYRVPEGTYFLLADYSAVFQGSPVEFARYLTREIGVACIPPTSFYSPDHAHLAQGYARFAYCKSDEMLAEVEQRLKKLR